MPSNNQNEEASIIHGLVGLLIIFSIPFWYWWCSDGIRAIKNSTIETMINSNILALPRDYGQLKAMGYDTNKLTLDDAIQSTKPTKTTWESGSINLGNDKNNVTVITTTLDYATPFKGEIKRIVYSFAAKKEHFYHFNPTPLTPLSVSILKNDDNVISYNMDNNPNKVLDAILLMFKK